MDWSGVCYLWIIVMFISCLDSHSDGTHSQQMILFNFNFSFLSEFSTSAAHTYTNLYSFIPIYILIVFYRGLCIYNLPDLCYFIPKNMVKMYVFSLDVDSVFLFMEWQKEIQYIFCKNL